MRSSLGIPVLPRSRRLQLLLVACLWLFLPSCKTWQWDVEKQPMQAVMVKFKSPEGAQVHIDDEFMGTIPCEVAVNTLSPHKLRIDMDRESVAKLGLVEQELVMVDARAKARRHVLGTKDLPYVSLFGSFEVRPSGKNPTIAPTDAQLADCIAARNAEKIKLDIKDPANTTFSMAGGLGLSESLSVVGPGEYESSLYGGALRDDVALTWLGLIILMVGVFALLTSAAPTSSTYYLL